MDTPLTEVSFNRSEKVNVGHFYCKVTIDDYLKFKNEWKELIMLTPEVLTIGPGE